MLQDIYVYVCIYIERDIQFTYESTVYKWPGGVFEQSRASQNHRGDDVECNSRVVRVKLFATLLVIVILYCSVFLFFLVVIPDDTCRTNVLSRAPQVAANTRGVALLRGLASEYGLDVISAYMGHIQVRSKILCFVFYGAW